MYPNSCDVVSNERVDALASNITCLQRMHDTMYYNAFTDSCTSLCSENPFASRNELWRPCILYNLESRNIELFSTTISGGICFADSPPQRTMGSSFTDTELATCLVDLCQQQPSTCASNHTSRCSAQDLLSTGGVLSIDAAVMCREAICTERTIDPDIAGIGVYISYILQFSLTFSLIIAWVIFRIIQSCLLRSKQKRRKTPTEDAQNTEPSWAAKVTERTVELALSVHKAQCLFALSLAISSTYFIRSNAETLTDIDQRALTVVTGTGVYPLTIMLLFLTIVRLESISRFTLLISFSTWLWSIIIARYVVGSVAAVQAQQRPVPSCNSISIPEFCKRTIQYDTNNYFSTVFAMAICVVTWHINWYKSFGKQRSDFQSGCSDRLVDCNFCSFLISAAFLMISCLAALICLILWVEHLVRHMERYLSRQWTFGQIIAVLLWLPITLEILELCGYGLRYICSGLWPKFQAWLRARRKTDGVTADEEQTPMALTSLARPPSPSASPSPSLSSLP